jgi:hypothetical protein
MIKPGILLILLIVLYTLAIGATNNGFDLDGSLVPADEIHLGGPARDGIPSIDNPSFLAADEARFLDAEDRVLGLFLDGQARAYPIAILNWHEVVNDSIGEKAVAVTFCPLCGTGIAFDAGTAQQPRTFGVSGLLYNSDVLLYDRESESLWSQIMMQAISGPAKGDRLKPLALQHTSWQAWRERHPETQVLSTDTGFSRDYDSDPYAGYASSEGLYFSVSASSRRYHAKEQVLGLEIEGQFKAYPFTELARSNETQIDDNVAGKQISIEFDHNNRSATAFDSTGQPLPTVTSYWFAWYAFHPQGAVYSASPRVKQPAAR